MRPPILLPGSIPPVQRRQPFVARHGNLYRVEVYLMSGERVRFRIRALTRLVARFRGELLYSGRVFHGLSEVELIEGIEPDPFDGDWRTAMGWPKRRPYIQTMGRAIRRLFKRDETDDC